MPIKKLQPGIRRLKPRTKPTFAMASAVASQLGCLLGISTWKEFTHPGPGEKNGEPYICHACQYVTYGAPRGFTLPAIGAGCVGIEPRAFSVSAFKATAKSDGVIHALVAVESVYIRIHAAFESKLTYAQTQELLPFLHPYLTLLPEMISKALERQLAECYDGRYAFHVDVVGFNQDRWAMEGSCRIDIESDGEWYAMPEF